MKLSERYHTRWKLLPGETLQNNRRRERMRRSAKHFQTIPDIVQNMRNANKDAQYSDVLNSSRIVLFMRWIMFRFLRVVITPIRNILKRVTNGKA